MPKATYHPMKAVVPDQTVNGYSSDGVEELEPLLRLTKDLRAAAATLGPQQARFLVDLYYAIQKSRVRANNQISAVERAESPEPHLLLDWVKARNAHVERAIASALGTYGDAHTFGVWMKTIPGIGPVLSAGELAHLDVRKAKHVSSFWRYAGLDPTAVWKTGELRPWNAALKLVNWKLGESLVKQMRRPGGWYYGHIYVARKAKEIALNEAGRFAEQAAASLAVKRYGKGTVAYQCYNKGMLPPARIQERAKRPMVKVFLSHCFNIMREIEYGPQTEPEKPWVLVSPLHPEHRDYIPPPNWPMRDGVWWEKLEGEPEWQARIATMHRQLVDRKVTETPSEEEQQEIEEENSEKS